MLVATTDTVAGHRVRQTLGQCFGVTVRSRGIGGNIMAGLRTASSAARSPSIARCSRKPAATRSTAWCKVNATLMGANGIPDDALRQLRDRPGQ